MNIHVDTADTIDESGGIDPTHPLNQHQPSPFLCWAISYATEAVEMERCYQRDDAVGASRHIRNRERLRRCIERKERALRERIERLESWQQMDESGLTKKINDMAIRKERIAERKRIAEAVRQETEHGMWYHLADRIKKGKV